MKLHEFQSKSCLTRYGITAPPGRVADSPEAAREVAMILGGSRFAVKAQVPAGGRAAAGGILIVEGPDAVEAASRALLGSRLTSDQTGPEGYLVRQVLVETAVNGPASFYLGAMIEPTSAGIVILGARGGETDIEAKVRAGRTTIGRLAVGPNGAIDAAEARAFAARLAVANDHFAGFCAVLTGLAEALIGLDATLVEINPLVLGGAGGFVALDAKIVLDDNAAFRHPERPAEDPVDQPGDLEASAQRHRINYVRMDGDIGLVANGAGLGMATVDLVRAADGRPANFMDIRTTATSLDVAHGIALLLENPAVKVILVNVHGGGMQSCDTVGDGLGIAMRRTGRKCPVVVRFAGNNADFARARLANFGCKIVDCADMWTPAATAARMARPAEAPKAMPLFERREAAVR
ncbi:MAG: succinyl-CoA synthetase subunit beta [Fulvimarina sp.]|nr:succinyl-CoA synthetase subunit beta [Fulvimarina sp.]